MCEKESAICNLYNIICNDDDDDNHESFLFCFPCVILHDILCFPCIINGWYCNDDYDDDYNDDSDDDYELKN